MDLWTIAEYVAWLIAVSLIAWMLLDAARVGREYNEDMLLSSREGELEQLTETAQHGNAEGSTHG